MFLNSVVSDYASIILGRIQIRYSTNANPDPEYRKSFRIHNTGFASLPNNFFLLVKFNKILGTLPVVTLKKKQYRYWYRMRWYKSIRLLNFCLSSFVCSPTRETIADYRESFGDDFFCFWVRGVCFLVLNSQFYEDPSNVLELYEGMYQYPDLSAISSVEEPIVLRIRIRLRSGSLIKN